MKANPVINGVWKTIVIFSYMVYVSTFLVTISDTSYEAARYVGHFGEMPDMMAGRLMGGGMLLGIFLLSLPVVILIHRFIYRNMAFRLIYGCKWQKEIRKG